MRVLLIDDSKSMRAIMRAALQPMGKLDIVEAHDGVDATSKVIACKPQLILCDSDMPKMNGLELLEKVRADARFATLPVLMLTTEGQPELIAKAKSLGARGWMVKPFKPEQLVAAAKKLTAR